MLNYISPSTFDINYAQNTILTTGSATPVVTLTEVKAHLKLDTSADDTLITSLIASATDLAEKYTKLDFITKTYKTYLREFKDYIEIRKAPSVVISSVKYYDINGALQTLSNTTYALAVSSSFPILYATTNNSFPSVSSVIPQPIIIEYTCGYGATAAYTPDAVKQALLIIIAYMYEDRGDTLTGNGVESDNGMQSIPKLARHLLNQFRVVDLGYTTNIRV